MRFDTQWVIQHWSGSYVVHVGPGSVAPRDEALTRRMLFVLSHDFRSGGHDARRIVLDLHTTLFGGVSNFVSRGVGASLGFSNDDGVLGDLARAVDSGRLRFTSPAPRAITYKPTPADALGPAPAEAAPTVLHYVEIELLGADDEPMAGEAYKLKLPDGRELSGSLDSRGRALVEDIAKPGTCEVSFPNLTAGAW